MQFKKYPFCKLLALLIFCSLLVTNGLHAQAPNTSIKNVIARVDTFNARFPAEKLYMQFDKPYYAVGDTLWFKSYLLNQTLMYSPLSSRLYVELVTDSNKVVRRMAFPINIGITWGNISLGELREGGYSIRAYTNWMRNFGQDYFFEKTFYVANPQKAAYLVNAAATLSDQNTVSMNMKFTSRDNISAGLKPMQLKVLQGKKVIFKGTTETGSDGSLKLNFPLPEKTTVKNMSLIAQDKADTKRNAIIPISTNRAKDVDVQFMPESGYMIAGLPAHIGFKAIGDDGRGVNITGKIINSATNQDVLQFESLHNGMGVIDLAPQANDVYVARVTLPGGQTKDVPLPAIKTSGTELRVRNLAARDSMDVYVFMTPDMIGSNSLFLVGQSRGVVCFGATIPSAKAYSTIHISKSLFPTGVVHFTLLNALNQPLNERLTFVNHHDNLKISIQSPQKTYAPRDSVALQIAVNDEAGKPVRGSFSVAVTDDGQVKNDTESADNILSHLLLASDLKGYIEDAGYYFQKDNAAWQALDALLLTQGWAGYDWKAVNALPTPEFAPEYQYIVSGRVGNLLNKPVVKADVVLFSTGKYRFIKDTLTDARGRFVFDKFPPIDSVTFVLQARNARHKVVNAGITVDEAKSPNFLAYTAPHATPWYVNSDPTLLNYAQTSLKYRDELDKAKYGPQGKLLREVTIRNSAIVKDSKNLNGAGEADLVIDQEAIENADKTTLGDLLQQKIPGFRTGYMRKSTDQAYFVKDKKVHFVFDGVDVNRFYQPLEDGPPVPNQQYEYFKQYLDYFTAEDIKGIEVAFSSKYNARYNTEYLTPEELINYNPVLADNVYIEITTRSGNGPFTQTSNGIYVYKPMKLTFPKEFYRPRYAVNSAKKFTDLRSTIHWQPTVVTDESGKANVSFYAADKPTTYTVIFEGADLNGKIGYQTQKITVGSSLQ